MHALPDLAGGERTFIQCAAERFKASLVGETLQTLWR